MSLLADYEELSQSQDLGIFKEVLDETLRPILISLEEKFFKLHRNIDEVEIKLGNLSTTVYDLFDDLKLKQHTDIIEANQQYLTYYHNLLKEISVLSRDVESIKLSLNK